MSLVGHSSHRSVGGMKRKQASTGIEGVMFLLLRHRFTRGGLLIFQFKSQRDTGVPILSLSFYFMRRSLRQHRGKKITDEIRGVKIRYY